MDLPQKHPVVLAANFSITGFGIKIFLGTAVRMNVL